MAGSLELFLNFDGNCEAALDFYAKVFKSKIQNVMRFNEAPSDAGYVSSEEDKNRIMYASISIFGSSVMFSDVPSSPEFEFIKGNNISPTIGHEDEEEIRRIFNELKEGGVVEMELQKTFWSNLFGMVTDKFGIIWQLSHYVPES